ncbi:phosphoribosylglycinamide formyltransferase [bacterium]|nr:MAG: phosphoribosylglycinamide formyltransferase [bacterium]
MPTKVAIVVGTKGRGSNMVALLSAMGRRPEVAVPYVVVAPSAESPALAVARTTGVRTTISGVDLRGALEGADYVCLAGYLRLVPPETVAAFPNRMLNIHPSLLPAHGGQGMYGLRVHQAVLDAGETVSGCTVHLVDEAYDRGEILLRRECPVLPDDTAETLAARVLTLEHEAYPTALFDLIEADAHH